MAAIAATSIATAKTEVNSPKTPRIIAGCFVIDNKIKETIFKMLSEYIMYTNCMYHHYKGSGLPRSDAIQKLVIERILTNPLTDARRENSKVWELKHSSSCIQIGRLLAIKRELNVELAEIICALHDIYAIDTGYYGEHAQKGAETAKELLHTTSQFSDQEIKVICDAIRAHSDKHLYSDDPYSELIKDADIFDCSLYEGTGEYYEVYKSLEVRKEYYHRIQKVREELGLPPDIRFTVK